MVVVVPIDLELMHSWGGDDAHGGTCKVHEACHRTAWVVFRACSVDLRNF